MRQAYEVISKDTSACVNIEVAGYNLILHIALRSGHENTAFIIYAVECFKVYVCFIHSVDGIRDDIEQIQDIAVMASSIGNVNKDRYTST